MNLYLYTCHQTGHSCVFRRQRCVGACHPPPEQVVSANRQGLLLPPAAAGSSLPSPAPASADHQCHSMGPGRHVGGRPAPARSCQQHTITMAATQSAVAAHATTPHTRPARLLGTKAMLVALLHGCAAAVRAHGSARVQGESAVSQSALHLLHAHSLGHPSGQRPAPASWCRPMRTQHPSRCCCMQHRP